MLNPVDDGPTLEAGRIALQRIRETSPFRSAREQAVARVNWFSSAVRHASVVLRAARARAIPSGVTVPGQPPRQSRSNAPS